MTFDPENIITDLNLSVVEKQKLTAALLNSIERDREELKQQLAADFERISQEKLGTTALEVLKPNGKKRGRPSNKARAQAVAGWSDSLKPQAENQASD